MTATRTTPIAGALLLATQRLRADGKAPVDWHLEALHEYRRHWTNSIQTQADTPPEYWRIRMRNQETREKWIRPMRLVDGEYRLGEPQYEPGCKPLYGAWEAEKYPEESVTVVEGEWCVDQFAFWTGKMACTSGSASSADDCDWSPLSGKVVVLWPDKDASGHAYMDRVAAILWSLGCRLIRIDVERIPTIKAKGDCVDWLDQLAKARGRWSHEAATEEIRKLPVVRNG